MSHVAANDLWTLVLGRPQVDPDDLAAALEATAAQPDPDFRTRLLIRDSLNALARHWGPKRLAGWISASPARTDLDRIWRSDLGECGFPTLGHRIMETTRRETVLQFLRDLGLQMSRPQRITIGGSIALILDAGLSRHTEDIDVVDEVPAEVRSQHELLENLARRYGLQLTHFQSHYLPAGWAGRAHSLGAMGNLQVFVVDSYDVVLSKLFSSRDKDRDDLRAVLPRLEKTVLADRLRTTCGALLGEERLRRNAEQNWYVLYGQAMPG